MKAAITRKYGPPEIVEIRDVPKPTPKDNEVLIKVRATTINSGDCRMRAANFPVGFAIPVRLMLGIFGPRQPILGMELAGEIEAIGRQVTKFKVGDRVFAECFAAHAEYRTLPENSSIVIKPASLSFEEAAAIPFGGLTALSFLRDKGKIQSGETVLINGASGATGTACVQLAKHFGAEVTGVCSGANLELVRSIGADHLIDYTREDFTKNGKTYDIIVDTAGTAPWPRSKRSLNKTGRLLLVLAGLPEMIKALFVSKKHGKKAIAGVAGGGISSLRFLADLCEKGKFKPVIDRTYPFEKIVEAYAYADTGRKKGCVTLSLTGGRSDATTGQVPGQERQGILDRCQGEMNHAPKALPVPWPAGQIPYGSAGWCSVRGGRPAKSET